MVGLCRGKQASSAVLHAAFELLGSMVASHAERMACQPLEGPCSTPFASQMHLHGGPLQTGAAMPADRCDVVASLQHAGCHSGLRVSGAAFRTLPGTYVDQMSHSKALACRYTASARQ